ncbi:MAG TPA: PadR family transcriptional regulator [Burkholderiaceae bacterium]|jgi:DNA-binding PadR family transcriptional regulator|nr:PadR family transcriptional regulator [Burkholderiaceae bacterium]
MSRHPDQHRDHHHSRHGGFGRFGDGDSFTRGRKFSSSDLQLFLLALLADKPAHGYELIKAMETRSNGFYTPSPGMVYPALTYLEELGQVTVTLHANRKCYTLADGGRAHIAENQERLDGMLDKLDHIARKMDSVRRAYSGEPGADAGEDGKRGESESIAELIAARYELKRALSQFMDAPADEQRRVAGVLHQATRQILDGKKNPTV